MELTLLTVPDCPNAAAFEQRLAAALAGRPGAGARRRGGARERGAGPAGVRGPPRLVINCVDPFGAPGQVPGLACRLYRDAAGRAAGAPTAAALRRALHQASAQDQDANQG